jgi:hypothetical protein
MKILLILLNLIFTQNAFATSAYYCESVKGAIYTQYIAMGKGFITVGPMHQNALNFNATLDPANKPGSRTLSYLGEANGMQLVVIVPASFSSLAKQGRVQFIKKEKAELYAEYSCVLKTW